MAKIHMMLQGKGGVGKSMISAMLAQYKIFKGTKVLCIDTDPVNATFSGFKALNVQKLEIMEGDEIKPRKFDMLIEMIADNKIGDVIIDNGASTFVPLFAYMVSNEVSTLLEGMGHELAIHTIVTGGQAQSDTVQGFSQLAKKFPESVLLAVWLNPYWGPVTRNDTGFEEFKVYKEHKKRVSAILNVPELKEETFGRDLSDILKEHLTFDEAISKETMTIMSRQRLKIIQKRFYDMMDGAVVL